MDAATLEEFRKEVEIMTYVSALDSSLVVQKIVP